MKTSCAGCIFLDDYFGDCCHPDLTFKESMDKCVDKDHALKKVRETKPPTREIVK